MTLKFDDAELRDVARAVIRYNPFAKSDSIEGVVAEMRRCALERIGYVSTYGFVLTTFRLYGDEGDGLGVKASVAAHLFSEE